MEHPPDAVGSAPTPHLLPAWHYHPLAFQLVSPHEQERVILAQLQFYLVIDIYALFMHIFLVFITCTIQIKLELN
uniref:Uncharacterized protein n=1 Tax=Anguilla anguilla TaxID=7936 RepID=A0A0E9XY98_ANGAN